MAHAPPASQLFFATGEIEDQFDDFEEFDKSGAIFSEKEIVSALLEEDYAGPEVTELRSSRLAADIVLVKYATGIAGAAANRSSIWVRRAGAWKMVHHQGTPRR